MDCVGANYRFTNTSTILLFQNPNRNLNGHYCGITTRKLGDFRSNVCRQTGKNHSLMKNLGCNCVIQMVPKHSTRHFSVDTKPGEVDYHECDALSFLRPSLAVKPLLLSNTGDCPTIAIMTDSGYAGLLIHASLKNIGLNFIGIVLNDFLKISGSNIDELSTFIWPGISQTHYEIENYFMDIFPKDFAVCFAPGRPQHSYFNLAQAIMIELAKNGLSDKKICHIPGCSFSSRSEAGEPLFYSARGGDSSRNGVFLALT